MQYQTLPSRRRFSPVCGLSLRSTQSAGSAGRNCRWTAASTALITSRIALGPVLVASLGWPLPSAQGRQPHLTCRCAGNGRRSSLHHGGRCNTIKRVATSHSIIASYTMLQHKAGNATVVFITGTGPARRAPHTATAPERSFALGRVHRTTNGRSQARRRFDATRRRLLTATVRMPCLAC